jgi:dihydrofolate reductase
VAELTADLFCTVDGWAAGLDAPAFFGCDGPDLRQWIADELARPQVLVMGRGTYEMLAPMPRDGGRMDTVPKLVVSRTLTGPLDWNARATPDLAAERGGDPLRVIGSLTLVRSLLAGGLVDRLRLLVFPQVLGATGREPVFAGLPDLHLDLVTTQVLDSRLVLLDYRPR